MSRAEASESRLGRQLSQVLARAEGESRWRSINDLADLCSARRADKRLLALLLMRKQMEQRGPIKGYLQLARRLVADTNNNCRWQALIVLGEFIAIEPDGVWRVIAAHGSSRDEDMRSAIACVLLEHLLEARFEETFRRCAARIRGGDHRFARTLATCWTSGLSRARQERIRRLLAGSGVR